MHAVLHREGGDVRKCSVRAVEAPQQRGAETIPCCILIPHCWGELVLVADDQDVSPLDRIGQQHRRRRFRGLARLVR